MQVQRRSSQVKRSMDILISFAAKVAEYTVEPIARQVGYLMFYNAKFEELADHVKELQGARDEVMHQVEEERRSGKIIHTHVQNWLDDVDLVIIESNKLQQDHSHAKVRCFKWSFPNLVLWHPLGRKAAKMSKNIVQILAKKKFEQVAFLPAVDGAASTYVTKGDENFESRKAIKEDIIKALRDPKTRKIGVYGVGGVGKTTLVKEVAQLAKQEKLFDVVITADVSKTPDLKTIQGEIADQLGLPFEEETVAGRALRLYQRIMTEKSILIILDDIWKRLDLEKVGVPFRDDHNGCKLLMTSRSQGVLREMSVQEYFRLEVLNEEETWRLFKAMAGDVETEPLVHQLAHQVAQRCAGLPILIVTIARSLINQDIHMWKDALRQLERTDNEEMQEITYSALELTYNRLQGKEMKALFLLCAASGERPFVSDLFKYGMGLGIFNNTNSMGSARDRFYKMISALKASCLLLEGDTSTRIRMHDVVREVAISIASRDQHMLIKYGSELKEWPTKDFLRSCSQINLIHCHIHKFPEILDCPNLKLLHLSSDGPFLEVPDSCFEEMKSLQVLDLTGFNLASLPISFHSLSSLKTLCLDHCILENMEAIEALENLEILSLIHSSMIKLPSEIGKLTHLRILDLSNSGIEVMPPEIISSLIRLEELYLGNTSIKWDEDEEPGEPKENASLTELRVLSNLTALELQIHEAWILPRDLMFDKLEKFKIVIGDVWEWDDIAFKTFRTLKLKLSTNVHLEHGIKTLIKRVENLYLDEVEGIENVLYQLNGEGFPELKHLHIQNHAIIKHIIDSVDENHAHSSFPKLETLVVQNLNCLEKICQGPLIVNSFAKLRIIKVESCIQLKYLLSFSTVKGLPQLSEIEVCRCNSMEKVVSGDGDANADNEIEFFSLHSLTLQQLQSLDSFFSYEFTSPEPMHQTFMETRISFFKAQVAFPNLETLKLSSLSLNNIWEDNQQCFHKLTNLIVESCAGLKYLFSYSMVRSFPNLMKLEISDCNMMEGIIATKEGNNNIVASEEVRFSKLDTIILKDMENLKTIWHKQFDTLKTLQVENCQQLEVVFLSSMQKTYTNLETLIVADCPLVKEIFELTSSENCAIEDTTHLKRITLRRLPELKHTWSRDPEGIVRFPNLEDVCLESCVNLQYLFPFSVATSCSSNLQRLQIKWCGNMKEVIAQKEGTLSTNATFKFNQLNTLLFSALYELKGFYASSHTLECPSLRRIDVGNHCAQLTLFRTVSISSHKLLTEGKDDISIQQSAPFIVEQVVPNLEELRINQKEGTIILQAQAQRNVPLFTKLSFLGLCEYENEDSAFPDWFLQNVNTLEWLSIEVSSFKKIFMDERRVNEKICMRLKKLTLNQLPKLLHICEEGFQIDPVLEVLEYLNVDGCPSLPNLVPSSVTFSHMVYLEIHNCNGMVNLISSSTARSLAKLTEMKVNGCNSLEEIIMVDDQDETIHDMTFLSLEVVVLECLPRLNRFFSSRCFLRFPLLKEVVIRQCPRMKNFSEGDISTPKLRKVRTGENKREGHWKGDLNSTIKDMFDDEVC